MGKCRSISRDLLFGMNQKDQIRSQDSGLAHVLLITANFTLIPRPEMRDPLVKNLHHGELV